MQRTSDNVYSGISNSIPKLLSPLTILGEEVGNAPVPIQGKPRQEKVGAEASERIGAGKRLAQVLV
jgi:hypothetical protein